MHLTDDIGAALVGYKPINMHANKPEFLDEQAPACDCRCAINLMREIY